jgi:hypothetical protein
MERQACIVCGATARPGRHSCIECGGAVVTVGDAEHAYAGARASSAASPASYGGTEPWISTPGTPDAAPTPPKRSRRPFVIASIMLVLVVGVVATIGFVSWRDYRDQPLPTPKDLAAYGKGEGRTYTTKWFIVRLPDQYRLETLSLPAGKSKIPLQMAFGAVGHTVLFTGSAPLPTALLADADSMQRAMGAELAQEVKLSGATKTELHKIKQEGGFGYDVVITAANPPQIAFRMLFVRDHMVILGAASTAHVAGALAKLAASFQLV